MPYFEVKITAEREEAARIAELLSDALEGEATVSWFEEGDGWAVQLWLAGEDDAEINGRIRDILGADAFGLALDIKLVDETVDWVSISLEGLKPVVAGRFVVFGQHDRDHLPAGLIGLQIEANQAFGTGHHPTTWGCLVALSTLLRRYHFDNVLDLGSGSGVLAIAVAKDTKRRVLASDIDPLAVEIAIENAGINGVAGLFDAVTCPGFEHALLRTESFDLVIANILAGPLKMLSPQFRAHMPVGGIAVLSGILSSQAASVLAAFRAQGFIRRKIIQREGWSTLVLQRT